MVSGMLVFDLMVFFWKMVVDVYDSVCKNFGYIINDDGGIRVD